MLTVNEGIKDLLKIWKSFKKEYNDNITNKTIEKAYSFLDKYKDIDNNIDIIKIGLSKIPYNERANFLFWLYYLVNNTIVSVNQEDQSKNIKIQNLFMVLDGSIPDIQKIFDSKVLQNAIRQFLFERQLITENAEVFITSDFYTSDNIFDLSPFDIFEWNDVNIMQYLEEEIDVPLDTENLKWQNEVYGFMISIVWEDDIETSSNIIIDDVIEELSEYCLMYMVTNGPEDTFINICDFAYDMVDFSSIMLVSSITKSLVDALKNYTPQDIKNIFFISEEKRFLIALQTFDNTIIGPIVFSDEYKTIVFMDNNELFEDVFKDFYSKSSYQSITMKELLNLKNNSKLWN